MCTILSLPSLCVDSIAEALASPGRTEDRTASVAASLAAACSAPAVRQLTLALWEKVDPGCVAEARAAMARRQGWMRCVADFDLGWDQASVVQLREACRAVRAPSGGTKEKLLSALLKHRDRAVDHAQRCLAACDPHFGHGASWPECPVRSLARLLVSEMGRASRSGRKTKITATACRQNLGITEKLLCKLPCALKRNPHGRSAPPMRLYDIVDVRRAQVQAKGSNLQDPESRVALVLRAEKQAKKVEVVKRARREALKSELTKQGMDSEPSVHREILDLFLAGKAKVGLEEVRAHLRRHTQLSEALTAVSLSAQPREDSELCAGFLKYGHGDVNGIAAVMARMHFLHVHTAYLRFVDVAFERARADMSLTNDYPRPSPEECREIRQSAEPEAMDHWIDKVGGLEAALAHPDLPTVLRDEVRSAHRRTCGHKRRRYQED